jgi:hypothetical protein
VRVRLLRGADSENGWLEAGTEIEHPDAYRLCAAGLAEPLDEEAKQAAASFLHLDRKLAAMRAADDLAARARTLAAHRAHRANPPHLDPDAKTEQ